MYKKAPIMIANEIVEQYSDNRVEVDKSLANKIFAKNDTPAIVRARVQSSYKDPNERSCVDALIQSALLNLGSQHTYDALTDERTGNPELQPSMYRNMGCF